MLIDSWCDLSTGTNVHTILVCKSVDAILLPPVLVWCAVRQPSSYGLLGRACVCARIHSEHLFKCIILMAVDKTYTSLPLSMWIGPYWSETQDKVTGFGSLLDLLPWMDYAKHCNINIRDVIFGLVGGTDILLTIMINKPTLTQSFNRQSRLQVQPVIDFTVRFFH